MAAEAPGQGRAQRGQLGAQPAAREVGEHGRVGGAVHEGLEHRPAGRAEDVGGDAGEPEAGVLQDLVQAIGDAPALLGEGGPIAGEVAQIANRGGGHEAARSSPCSSTRAIHPQSCTSVLRPGTCLR